jgi:hypothetical protein
MNQIQKMEQEGQYQLFHQNHCSKNLTEQLCRFILVRNLPVEQSVDKLCHQPKTEKFLHSRIFKFYKTKQMLIKRINKI